MYQSLMILCDVYGNPNVIKLPKIKFKFKGVKANFAYGRIQKVKAAKSRVQKYRATYGRVQKVKPANSRVQKLWKLLL